MGRSSLLGGVAGGAVAAAASEFVDDTDALADEIAVSISAAVPPLSYDDILLASNNANLRLGFRMLRDGVPGEHAVLPLAAGAYGREVPHRVASIEPILAAYRIGCASFWRRWSTAITERVTRPSDVLAAMDGSAAFMLGYHESLSRQITDETDRGAFGSRY